VKLGCPMGHVFAIDPSTLIDKCPVCGQKLREVVRDQGGDSEGRKLRD